MKRLLLVAAIAALLGAPALAVEPAEKLADPALEARAESVGELLRCLVCQNESIEQSGASLAHDIRVLLRERIKAGDSDAQAMQYIVDRYGEFVLLKPRVEPATYALWFGPAVILAGGGVVLALFLRRRIRQPETAVVPLDEADERRLARLLKD